MTPTLGPYEIYRTHNRNATTKGKGLGIRFKICLFYNYTLLKYGHATLE